MVQIDEKLLRGRAEHNDCCLSTLQEVSLHQQNIEGINKALTRLCPELQILYLQHNLIGKIENMTRLKEVDYLNLVSFPLSFLCLKQSTPTLTHARTHARTNTQTYLCTSDVRLAAAMWPVPLPSPSLPPSAGAAAAAPTGMLTSAFVWQAINNIKKIEGLERNEKLRKLDLTVNFIELDGLLGVEKLR